MSQNLFILSELFYPDQTSTGYIMTEITKALAEERIVNVICGPSERTNRGITTSEELSPNINIQRVNIRNWDKNKVGQRIVRLLALSFKMAKLLYQQSSAGDKVVVVTNPAPLLLLVARICRWKKLKFIIIVHDVFPENLKAANMVSDSGMVYKLLLSMFNKAYRTADHLIVLGRDMRDLFYDKVGRSDKRKITVIPNWADTENVYPLSPEPSETLKIQFAGNFGRLQGLLPLLEAIHAADNQNISVEFLGSGAMLPKMQAYVAANGMSRVKILPPFPRSEQNQILNTCDLSFVSLAENMKGLGVPSKTYNILAVGKPIIYIGDPDSEIGQLIDEHNIGWKFANYGEKLISFIKELTPACRMDIITKGNNARNVALQEYSKSYVLAAYQKEINSI